MIKAASFIADQKAYFKEAIEHWQRLAALGLPDCDDTNDEEGNGQMTWRRGHDNDPIIIDLMLSNQMQWVITKGSGRNEEEEEEWVFDALEEDNQCLAKLQSLLPRKTIKRKK